MLIANNNNNDIHLQVGAKSLKEPVDWQVRTAGPTIMFPASHWYSTRLPTLKLLATIVELAGCSGFPQDFGPNEIRIRLLVYTC